MGPLFFQRRSGRAPTGSSVALDLAWLSLLSHGRLALVCRQSRQADCKTTTSRGDVLFCSAASGRYRTVTLWVTRLQTATLRSISRRTEHAQQHVLDVDTGVHCVGKGLKLRREYESRRRRVPCKAVRRGKVRELISTFLECRDSRREDTLHSLVTLPFGRVHACCMKITQLRPQ